MTFPEWSAAIVAGVRAFLPDVRAARKGARVVIIRHGDREARLEAGASFWITLPAGEMKTTMASLVDDRRDAYTQRDHINIYGFRALVIASPIESTVWIPVVALFLVESCEGLCSA